MPTGLWGHAGWLSCRMAHLKLSLHEIEKLRNDAWVGDAVLELYVRSWVLREQGTRHSELKKRFTQNSFLNSLDQPTRVEARIGVVFQEQGLEAAFAWIKEHLEPLFLKQEAKRNRSHRP